MIDFLDSF